MIDKNILIKYRQRPWACSMEEIEQVEGFLSDYLKYRDIYRDTFGDKKVELCLESDVFNVRWQRNRSSYKIEG